MKEKNNQVNLFIVILSFGLLVFHTFTYFQNYYSYIITLSVFAVIIVLAFLKSKGVMHTEKSNTIFFLGFMVAVIIFIGYSVKNRPLTELLGSYLPYIIWPIIFLIVDPILDDKGKRRFLLLYLIVYFISIVATLSVVATDNNASRLLAGAAHGAERSYYYAKGVGGYGFIYGCVFLLYGIILWMRKESNGLCKLCLLSTCVITIIMIIYASYTTALLLSIILMFMSFYVLSKNKNATVLFVVFIILAILLIEPILQIIHNMAEQLELEWIENRIGQLLNAEETGSIGELKRAKLYMRSLNTFWQNIILGGTRVGGHSMLFDHMGLYGIFGLLFCISYFVWLNTMRSFTKKRVGLVYILLIAFFAINTLDTIVMLPMVQFVLPLLLSIYKEEINIEKNIND